MPSQNNNPTWSDRLSTYCLYALIAFVPAIFSTSLYTTFSAPKLITLHLITCLILLLWGGKIFAYQKFEYKKSPLNILLFISAIIAIITTITSISFFSSLYGTYGRFIGVFTVINLLLLTFIVANHLNKKTLQTALLISIGTASLLAIYGLIQYFNYFQETFNWSSNPAERVFGTLGHPNHFGAYLGINLILGIGMFSQIKNRILKYSIPFGLAIQAIVILLTASRAAIISTIVGLIVILIFLTIKHRTKIRVHLARFTLGIFIALVLSATAATIYQQEIAEFPLIKRTTEAVQNIEQGNIPDRLSWWLSGVSMISDKPIFGHGLSTFHDTFNQYRRTDFHTLEQNGMEYRITPETAHNEFINIGAAQGIVGLVTFLLVLSFAYYQLSRQYFHANKDNTALAILGALTVFIVDIFFGFGVVATYTFFYILLGATIIISNKDNKKSVRSINLDRYKKYPVALIIIMVGIFGLFGTARFALAEIYYKQAIKAQFEGDRNIAIANFELATSFRSGEYAYHHAFGDYALQTARQEQAIKQDLLALAAKQYEAAIALNSHHPSSYFNLGATYLELFGETSNEYYLRSAEDNFKISVEKAINNPLYPYHSGVALMTLDTPEHLQMALKYFEKANEAEPHYLDIDARIFQITQVLN